MKLDAGIFERIIESILFEVDVDPYLGQNNKEYVVTTGLKVYEKSTKLMYTIVDVFTDNIVLRNPDGETFKLSIPEFEKAYTLEKQKAKRKGDDDQKKS